MTSRLMDPEYWRSRAEEARAQAVQMTDARARKTLLAIAENYEQIAEQQERLVRGAPPPERTR
jgi:hypothetical protein